MTLNISRRFSPTLKRKGDAVRATVSILKFLYFNSVSAVGQTKGTCDHFERMFDAGRLTERKLQKDLPAGEYFRRANDERSHFARFVSARRSAISSRWAAVCKLMKILRNNSTNGVDAKPKSSAAIDLSYVPE